MGGNSSSTQTQQSTTAPWLTAQPTLSSILGQVNGQLGNTGVTSGEQGALNTIIGNSGNTSQFNPAINASTASLLAGGGANNQAGNVNNAYQQYAAQTNPLASNTNYNPYNTPGFSDALNTANSDISNSVNGQFAAAGRDMSGANSQALGRGLAQGDAQLIANQYNQNVQNQQGAASNLYNAGNTNAGILSGLQQQSVANQQAGVNQVGTGLNAQNAGATSALQAYLQQQGIPIQNLGLLSQIGIPIAGLGSQSTGTAQGTAQESGAQQFGQIAGGVGNILGGLFGGKSSDVRLKQDIKRVGTLDNGLPVYLYRYKSGGPFEIGLMAQDVEQAKPDAVDEDAKGFKMVDYKMAVEAA
jgi:hypothetical protein